MNTYKYGILAVLTLVPLLSATLTITMEPRNKPTTPTSYFAPVFQAINNRELGQAYNLAIGIRTGHGDAELQRLADIVRNTAGQDIPNKDVWRNLSKMLQEEIRSTPAPSATSATTGSTTSTMTPPHPSLLEYWSQPDIQSNVLGRHATWVRSVAFSPDGKLLASGSWDTTIGLWNVETGREIRVLTGHTRGVESVAFSPDGKLLASGSWDNTIGLWNVETGREIGVLTGHTARVNSVAFSPDGRLLASGSDDKTIRLWNVETGTGIGVLSKRHTRTVYSVAFSPDGRLLASGYDDHTIRLWNVETGKEIRVLAGHTARICTVAFSPDGKLLASGSDDKTIRLWNVETGREIRVLTGHTARVNSVAFSPDGRLLASGSYDYDNTIRLWNVETGREIRVLAGHTRTVYSVAFSPDGRLLASGSADETIRLWRPVEIVTGECPVCLEQKTLVRCGICRHYICQTCKEAIRGSDRPLCPICRTPLDETIRLWRPVEIVTGECPVCLEQKTLVRCGECRHYICPTCKEAIRGGGRPLCPICRTPLGADK